MDGPRASGEREQVFNEAIFLEAASAKIRERLGWVPQHDDLDTIVRQALAWEGTLARFKLAS